MSEPTLREILDAINKLGARLDRVEQRFAQMTSYRPRPACEEATAALVALGFDEPEAARMAQSEVRPDLNSEQIVQAALRRRIA